MEPKYLLPYVARMKAAVLALEAAVKAEDPDLILEAHEAIGRARMRTAPQVASVIRTHERKQAALANGTGATTALQAAPKAIGR